MVAAVLTVTVSCRPQLVCKSTFFSSRLTFEHFAQRWHQIQRTVIFSLCVFAKLEDNICPRLQWLRKHYH